MSASGPPSRWRVPLVFTTYLVVFYGILPGGLWLFGRRIDQLLGLPPVEAPAIRVAGLALAALGVWWMAWSIWVLRRWGKGWPISHLPPTTLVREGPYGVTPHPIYVGYTAAFAGLGFAVGSLGVAVYAAGLLALGATIYVRGFEGPRLRRRFGEAYTEYLRDDIRPFERLLNGWIAAPDGLPRRGRVFLVVLAAYAFFAATYLPINFFTIGRPAHRLFLPGEARIPFLPAMEFLYLLGYMLPLLLVWQVSSVARLARMLRAFLLTLAVAYATYLTFPVYFERPVIAVDSVATLLLSLEYMDPSYNHFPSLHVGLGVLVYLALRDRPACRWWLGGIVAGMAVSTVFVKQHYAVDVVYGAMLAAVAWAVAGRWSSRA